MFKWLYLVFPLVLCGGCKTLSLHTAFYSSVCIKPYKNYLYHTCSDIHFAIEKQFYTIPKGFQTDLASIPKIAWSIMTPAHSALIRPAIVHDWFYSKTCDYTRYQTDLIFYHMLINDGISPLKASIMYYAVRCFGRPFYNRNYCE